jgi:hypothetical protein
VLFIINGDCLLPSFYFPSSLHTRVAEINYTAVLFGRGSWSSPWFTVTFPSVSWFREPVVNIERSMKYAKNGGSFEEK